MTESITVIFILWLLLFLMFRELSQHTIWHFNHEFNSVELWTSLQKKTVNKIQHNRNNGKQYIINSSDHNENKSYKIFYPLGSIFFQSRPIITYLVLEWVILKMFGIHKYMKLPHRVGPLYLSGSVLSALNSRCPLGCHAEIFPIPMGPFNCRCCGSNLGPFAWEKMYFLPYHTTAEQSLLGKGSTANWGSEIAHGLLLSS